MNTPSLRAVQRVRHPLKARRVTVAEVSRPSPHFVSVLLTGEDLRDFVSASFDDHIKLMLPSPPGQPLALPTTGPEGLVWPADGSRPVMRDYTPRRFDPRAGTLEIEFALHGDGPAAEWAAQAAPGQEIGIGGPRGSFVVPVDFDWHLLVGDETALPAISRRLEELPATTQAIVLARAADPADQREFTSRARFDIRWLPTGSDDNPAAWQQAVRDLVLPTGEGYAWAAGEAAAMAAVRRTLVEHHGLDKDRLRAAAYWKHGAQGHHENL